MAEGERGVYSPPPEDSYDARESGSRGVVLLAVSVVVLLAAAAMAWSTYNLGLREGGRDAPPRIVADAGPFRTEPADPGGFQTPDQDIEVYDSLSGEARDTEERFAPPPEEPLEAAMEPEVAEEPAPAPESAPEPERGIQIVEEDVGPAPVDLRPAPEEAAPAPQPEPEPAPAPAAQQPVQTATGGAWLVQLAALRTEDEARATWSRIASAHPAILSGASMDIQRADLGERGIYYRVRAAAFSTKPAAEDFCSRLKQAGQDCIVVGR